MTQESLEHANQHEHPHHHHHHLHFHLPRPKLFPSKRLELALLVFFAFVVQYSQRVNLPIAIVCMIDKPTVASNFSLQESSKSTTPITTEYTEESKTSLKSIVTKRSATDVSNTSLSSSITTTTQKVDSKRGGFFDEKRFIWEESSQQLLLSAYWAGYIFTQLPGGWMASTFGAKWVYAGSLGISSVATIGLTTMYKMAKTHVISIFVLRFITGLAHGVLFPATVALWAVWAVPHERSTLASIGFSGTHLGTAFTMLGGGLSCRSLASGWMYPFIATGILGFLWLILWVSFTSNTPDDHKSITDHERDYIVHLTGTHGKKRIVPLSAIPWKKILTSKPVITLMVTHITNLFGLFFFLTNLGKIVHQLLGISSEYTGYILFFGYLLTLTTSLFSGILADRLVRSNKATLTNVRKVSNALTSFLPAFCMVLLFFADKDNQLLGVVAVLIYLAASGLGYGSGYVVNFTDLIPAYSGVIFGLSNTFSSLSAVVGSLIAGAIIKEPVLSQWRKLYVIFGLVYCVGGLAFVLYGSAETRKWGRFQPPPTDAKLEEKANKEEMMPANEKL